MTSWEILNWEVLNLEILNLEIPNWEVLNWEIPTWLYKISVIIHIISFSLWFGGTLFIAGVIIPVLKQESIDIYGRIIEKTGKKFSLITWFLLFPAFVITGFLNAHVRTGTFNPFVWNETQTGKLILFKLHLFFIILAVSAFHDFLAGPRATKIMREGGSAEEARKWRKIAGWAGRINFIFGIFMILAGTSIVRGC